MSFSAFVANILGLAKSDEPDSAEQNLLAAVEHVCARVDPKVRWAPKYRQRLIPAVRRTLEYAEELVGRIPGPTHIRRGIWDQDPLVHSLFATPREVEQTFFEDPEICKFFRNNTEIDQACAVLTMTKQERTVYGVERRGNLVKRDVPQIAVEFLDHRVLAAAPGESELRRELTDEMLTYLAGQALEEILALKSWHQELTQEREILDLQLKIRRTRNQEAGSLLNPGEEALTRMEAEQVLEELTRKIREVRSRLDEPKDYLEHVQRVLLQPEAYVTASRETLRLNSMGIKIRPDSPEPVNEITLANFRLNHGHRRLAVLVGCSRADVYR